MTHVLGDVDALRAVDRRRVGGGGGGGGGAGGGANSSMAADGWDIRGGAYGSKNTRHDGGGHGQGKGGDALTCPYCNERFRCNRKAAFVAHVDSCTSERRR
jgi:hypothetical protein